MIGYNAVALGLVSHSIQDMYVVFLGGDTSYEIVCRLHALLTDPTFLDMSTNERDRTVDS